MQELLRLEPIFHEKNLGWDKAERGFLTIPSRAIAPRRVLGHLRPSPWRLPHHQRPFGRHAAIRSLCPISGLFNYMEYPQFPLLVKIIDSKDDLSVQVHPDDTYAKRIGKPMESPSAGMSFPVMRKRKSYMATRHRLKRGTRG